MRRCMAITRIFLFLSIVRFATAAPIVDRRVHEVHVNVADESEDGSATVTLQKRWERWDDWLTSAKDQTSLPTISALRPLQDSVHLPRSSAESNSASSSPAPSTGSPSRSPHYFPPSGSPPTGHSPTPASNLDHSPASNPGHALPSAHLGRTPTPGYSGPNSQLADVSYSPGSWSPKPPPSGSWPEFSPSTDNYPSLAPDPDHSPSSKPDHLLPLPLTSDPGHTAPNSWSADESHSPSLWSSKFSPSSSWSPKLSPPGSWPEFSPSTDHSPLPAQNADHYPLSNPGHLLPSSNPGQSTPNSWPVDESHSPSLWWSKFSPSSSWSPKLSPPGLWPDFSPSTDHSPSPAPDPDHFVPSNPGHFVPSNPDHLLPLPLKLNPGYSVPNSWSADESHSPSLWSSKFSPSSSWSPKLSPPGSWPEFSPSTDHSPSPPPNTDRLLTSPLSSNPGHSTPNSGSADESHLPGSWSPKFSPPGSGPELSPPKGHFHSPAPNPDHSLSDPDHLLSSPLTSNPGHSAENSWPADVSHSPSLPSPKSSPISSVPEIYFTSSPDHLPESSSSTGPHQSTDYPPLNLELMSSSSSESLDFLDKLLRGKIRRRISDSGAVNS